MGLTGGVQPSSFRMRALGVLGVLILVITVAAWFTSRWVVRPMARLSAQVDAIGRGDVPTEIVRGTREIERLATALTTMARQRAAFDEQRRVMLMGVSHDLRSPLTRIRVAADLLDQQAPLRDLIVRNVEHADAIIESFLSYVRTDAEQVADDVDLSSVANSAARSAGLPAAQVRIAPNVWVRGNATMLQRMLTNLLDNAARHGAPPILLSLAVDRAGRQAVLVVEDHGPGIVDAQRMLQPFERGDASRAQGGAGLGLAIVARIVERHDATLEIGTVDGGGTRASRAAAAEGLAACDRTEGWLGGCFFLRPRRSIQWIRLVEILRRLGYVRQHFGHPVARIGVLLPALQVIVRLLDHAARRGQLLVGRLVTLIRLAQFTRGRGAGSSVASTRLVPACCNSVG